MASRTGLSRLPSCSGKAVAKPSFSPWKKVFRPQKGAATRVARGEHASVRKLLGASFQPKLRLGHACYGPPLVTSAAVHILATSSPGHVALTTCWRGMHCLRLRRCGGAPAAHCCSTRALRCAERQCHPRPQGRSA